MGCLGLLGFILFVLIAISTGLWEILESGILNCCNAELHVLTVDLKNQFINWAQILGLKEEGFSLYSLKIPISFLRLSCEEACLV